MKVTLKSLFILALGLALTVSFVSSCQKCGGPGGSDAGTTGDDGGVSETDGYACMDVQEELDLCLGRIGALCDAVETNLADAMVPSRAQVDEEFSSTCGEVEMRIDHFDESRGWVHLAYRLGDETRYGHRMVLDDVKDDRNVLLVRDAEPPRLIILDGCSDDSCEVRCLPLFGETPACGTSLLPVE